ncbi:MAG: hypothetical protein K2W96_26030 [Gemmataceae bacterium]|nr:hypothetical protein [Gemmataceae bacterium]
MPFGAVARLGYARMVAGSYSGLSASLNGRFIRSVFAPNGREEGDSLRWFRVADGQRRTPFEGPVGCRLERIFADGSHLASDGKRLLLFARAGDKAPTPVLDLTPETPWFDVSGRWGLRAVGEGDKRELHVADLKARPVAWQRIAAGRTSRPSFSREGHAAWIEPRAGLLRVRQLPTGRTASFPLGLRKAEDSPGIVLSPDGKTAAVLRSGGLRLHDTATGRVLRIAEGRGHYEGPDAEFTPDGRTLVFLDDRRLSLIPVDPEAPIKSRRMDEGRFALLPDGKRLAACDDSGLIRIRDLATGERLDRYSVHPPFQGVAVVGKHRAASWTKAGRVLTWDMGTGEVLSTAEAGLVPYAFSPDGERFVGWKDPESFLAETRTGKVLAKLGSVRQVAEFGDGDEGLVCAYASEDGTAWLERRGPRDGRRRSRREISWELVHSALALSPDGRTILAARGGRIVALETATGKLRLGTERDVQDISLPRPDLMAFAGKGRRVVLSEGRLTRVLDSLTGRLLTLIGHDRFAGRIRAVSRDGRWLAVLGGRGRVLVHDLESRTPADPVAEWKPHRRLSGLDLDRDGSRLATSHEDGTCLVVDLAALRRQGWGR